MHGRQHVCMVESVYAWSTAFMRGRQYARMVDSMYAW